jgi:hypothetical protein
VDASVRATTVIAGSCAIPKRLPSSLSTWIDSMSSGTPSTPGRRSVVYSSGVPAASSTAVATAATLPGKRWTTRASRAKKLVSSLLTPAPAWRAARRPGVSRRRNAPSSAGVKVNETSIATMAMDNPAAPTVANSVTPNARRPVKHAATVSPLNMMVRPAVAHARLIAISGAYRAVTSSR